MDCFTKKTQFKKPGYPELEFVGDKRVLPTCVISTLEAKRLLHKGCEVYLAHVIDTSTSEMNLKNVPVVCEFSDVFSGDLPGLPSNRELELGSNYYRDRPLSQSTLQDGTNGIERVKDLVARLSR